VATVLVKLFNIVQPKIAVFGQKDAQQAFMVKRLVRDLDFDIEILIGPTIREPDGLALSSRNSYLTSEERKAAPVLYQALKLAESLTKAGERNPTRVIEAMRAKIEALPNLRIEYISIVDTKNLQEVKSLNNEVLIALAVWFGQARLIDNLILSVP
jgi:pantoate--beta-alanine ligase